MEKAKRLEIRDTVLHQALNEPLIMGILNVTPDSFSDGGKFNTRHSALNWAQDMVRDGAGIIDIGGESTRPGATEVSEAEEISRVLGPIDTIAERNIAPISIDTYKAEVARRAAEAGAVIINDISGMRRDADMANVVADTGSIIVVTYNRGKMDENIDLLTDARAFFDSALDQAEHAGIPREHIWLDPGVGFSKSQQQNYEILNRLDVLDAYQRPILVGLSRKSFIGALLDRAVDARLAGTIAANVFALNKGASIFRVHDVKANADAIRLYSALMKV